MIDQGASRAVDGRDAVPIFPDDEGDNGGWLYSKQVYRGVLFKDGEAASRVRMFVNAVADQQPEDRVLVRSWHEGKITDRIRKTALPISGLPWEPKGTNQAALDRVAAEDDRLKRLRRAAFESSQTPEDKQKAEEFKARYRAMMREQACALRRSSRPRHLES